MHEDGRPTQHHVLVTGATGFIGKHLVPELRSHARVRVLARTTSQLGTIRSYKDVEVVYGDIATGRGLNESLVDIDRVVHCAGRTIGSSYLQYHETNTLGTLHLVRAMQRNAVRKLILISTNAVHGPCADKKPACENDLPQPISHYGKTKKLAEDIVIRSELEYIILRPVAVYGPHDMDMLKYIQLMDHGICPTIGFGEKYLNMIYVKDLVRLITVCVEQKTYTNRAYFVNDGTCYRFSELVHLIAHILGKRVRIVRIPYSIAMLYSTLNDVFIHPAKRLIRRDKIHELAARYWLCSSEGITQDFGFRPRVSITEGLEATIQWYKEHNYLR